MNNENNARASIDLENPMRFEAPLAELSARFANPPAPEIDLESHENPRRIAETLDPYHIGLGKATR